MIGLRACGHFLHFNMGGKAGRKRVLATLLREGEISQRTLQDLLDIQSGSLSEILAKIEADGLLEKVKCGSDRRGYILRLTESGQALAKQVTACHEARVDKLVGLSERRRTAGAAGDARQADPALVLGRGRIYV